MTNLFLFFLYFASLHLSLSFLDDLKSFCASCTVPGTVNTTCRIFNKSDDLPHDTGLDCYKPRYAVFIKQQLAYIQLERMQASQRHFLRVSKFETCFGRAASASRKLLELCASLNRWQKVINVRRIRTESFLFTTTGFDEFEMKMTFVEQIVQWVELEAIRCPYGSNQSTNIVLYMISLNKIHIQNMTHETLQIRVRMLQIRVRILLWVFIRSVEADDRKCIPMRPPMEQNKRQRSVFYFIGILDGFLVILFDNCIAFDKTHERLYCTIYQVVVFASVIAG